MSQVWNQPAPDGVHWGVRSSTPGVPGLVGPYGQPVPYASPYNAMPPTGEMSARAMLAQSMPLDLVMQSGYAPGGGIQQVNGPLPPGVLPPGNMIAPPGVPVAPGLPPGLRPPGAVAAVGALTVPTASPFAVQRSEVRFAGPAGMKISWFAPGADGRPGFSAQYIEAPGRYNFLQAAVYRLKLSDIPQHPGLVLYPTLEVVPTKMKTATFLAHSAVPVNFTEEDFEQVAAGNFVVKVIYLPDPMFQDLAVGGPDEVVSSRLEPGVDPIKEAQRRGSIMLVVRLGNIDLEAPNTPAMDAPSPYCPPGAQAPVAPPGIAIPAMPAPAAPGAPAPAPGGPRPPAVLPPAGLPAGADGSTTRRSTSSPVQQTQYTVPAPKKLQPTMAQLAGELPPPPATPPLPNGSR
jgi:hypothetical protein